MKKTYTLRGQNGEHKPTKMEFGLQNQYGRLICLSIGNFIWSKKKYIFGVKKVKITNQSPKTEFGLKNQYSQVIYPSIGNFILIKMAYCSDGLFSPF
jgi:hypothetical protein